MVPSLWFWRLGTIVLNWNLEVPQITHKYIFPQFAFGGGWESTLMMLGPHRDTSCTFTAEGRYIEMGSRQGTELDLSFNNTWRLLKTTAQPSQEASSGMAILDCDKEVLVNVLFSLRANGSVVGEALVGPAEEIAPGEPAYFIDELGTIPEDHLGLVRIWAGRSVYAIGLKTTGPVFTTIPAMVIR